MLSAPVLSLVRRARHAHTCRVDHLEEWIHTNPGVAAVLYLGMRCLLSSVFQRRSLGLAAIQRYKTSATVQHTIDQ